MNQVDTSELRQQQPQPNHTNHSQQQLFRPGGKVRELGRQSSASLGRSRSSKTSEGRRDPDRTRARAEGTSGSDNSKQAIVGGLGQSSCPASDACEPMRAPTLYRPHNGQAPGFVGQLHAEAARKQRQVNYPCCALGGSPSKSAKQANVGRRRQQQVAGAAPMAVAPPIGGAQADCNEKLGMAIHSCPALDCDEAEDSECSCSNSLDCLANQTVQPPSHHRHQPPPAQQQLAPSLDSQQPPLLNSHHQHLNPPHRGHQHRHQQQLQLHRHQHHVEQEECSFTESPKQQNNRPRQPHQAQTFHRPLMANSSVPVLSASSGATLSGPPRQVLPAAPLLVRQATYTATADTITDSSPLGAPLALTPPLPPAQQQQATSASDFSNPANEWRQQQVVGQYRARTGVESIELQPAKQRQAVSFRRSATSVAGDQQQHRQRTQTMSRNLQLSQQVPATMPGQVMVAGESAATRGSANSTTTAATSATTASQQQQNSADRQAIGLQHFCPSSPVVGGAGNPAHSHRQQRLAGGAYSPGPPLTIAAATASAINRGSLLASQQLNGAFSLPPISSHRTNSPWMRISSIILAPLGLVIVLFIVVSPLLHSKNKF